VLKPPSRWIENLKAAAPRRTVSGCWSEDGSGVAFYVLGEQPITPFVGECPAETDARQVPLLIGRQEAKLAQFVAVLWPYRGKAELAVEGEGQRFTIRHGEELEVLTIPSDGSRPSVRRLALDTAAEGR